MSDAPRLASTLLLVRDDPFEVLMVLRNSRGSFASALVFPGGAVDEADRDDAWLPYLVGADGLDIEERAHRIAAVRETWEESGILLATRPDGTAPTGISGGNFRALVERNDLRIRLGDILPFAHWITPEAEPRRFDTRFYLARSPLGGDAVADGSETVSTRWVAPGDVASLAHELRIVFPTLMNLGRLAESSGADDALRAAASRPVVTVAPVIRVDEGGDGDGAMVITIPESAGYGVTEFRVPL